MPALGIAGCASSLRTWRTDRWHADYEAAERTAGEAGRDLLIYYHDDRQGRSDAGSGAMHSPEMSRLTQNFACCDLFRSYEPDRRYVGQFGVNRAPALIVVRSDGTFHAMPGTNDMAKIESFLTAARAPGKPVRVDLYVSRDARYQWHDSLEAAQSLARETGRPLFAVFYRTLSRDWSRLSEMLERREVSQRLAGAVPARIGRWGFKADAYVTPFGTLNLPAIVLARPDGTVKTLQLPKSYEEIVGFIDVALAAATAAKPASAAPTVAVQR